MIALVAALSIPACVVSADLEGKACTSNGACAPGFRCVELVCVPDGTDAGDGQGTSDSGPNAEDSGQDAGDRPQDAGNEDSGSGDNCGARGQACCTANACNAGLACVVGVCNCNQAITVNEYSSCAHRATGLVECVGANGDGQLGRGGAPGRDSLDVAQVALPQPAEQVRLGAFHGCATNGANVYCWGRNNDGQLGVELEGQALSTTEPTLLTEGPTTGFQRISLGSFHSCGLDELDRVWCWGRNFDGQIGVATPSGGGARITQPTLVEQLPGGSATDVAAGAFHSCALINGRVWCWGRNTSTELGVIGTTSTSVPQRTMVDDAIQIATGDFHSCALRADGSIWCWGRNSSGQLGRGFDGGGLPPAAVVSEVRFRAVAAMDDHTCAISDADALYCWGRNVHGQLGLRRRSAEPESSPRLVALDDVKQVAGGRQHTCALVADGTVYCFGSAGFGELGLGTRVTTATPTVSRLSCE